MRHLHDLGHHCRRALADQLLQVLHRLLISEVKAELLLRVEGRELIGEWGGEDHGGGAEGLKASGLLQVLHYCPFVKSRRNFSCAAKRACRQERRQVGMRLEAQSMCRASGLLRRYSTAAHLWSQDGTSPAQQKGAIDEMRQVGMRLEAQSMCKGSGMLRRYSTAAHLWSQDGTSPAQQKGAIDEMREVGMRLEAQSMCRASGMLRRYSTAC